MAEFSVKAQPATKHLPTVYASSLAYWQITRNVLQGEGNCQFASIADQLYRTTAMSSVVRHSIVNYLRVCAFSTSSQFMQMNGHPAGHAGQ